MTTTKTIKATDVRAGDKVVEASHGRWVYDFTRSPNRLRLKRRLPAPVVLDVGHQRPGEDLVAFMTRVTGECDNEVVRYARKYVGSVCPCVCYVLSPADGSYILLPADDDVTVEEAS